MSTSLPFFKLPDRWLQSWAWRLLPYAKLRIQLPNGVQLPLTRRGDITAFEELFLATSYEPFFSLLDQVTSFVDLGCNCGFFSAALISHAQKRGWAIKSALLVDADPEGVQLARELAKLNNWPQIKVEHALIGKDGEQVTFRISKKSLSSSTKIAVAPKSDTVMQARSLANLCREIAPDNPQLLKIDIEGSEIDLLENEPDVIARFPNVILEWHGHSCSGAQIKNFIEKKGLRVLHVRPVSQEPVHSPWDAKFGMVLWTH